MDCFKQCQRKFKYRYVDGLKTIPNLDAKNPLYLGSALHKGIETDVETAISEYQKNYYGLTDDIITQSMILEYWIPKVKALLPKRGKHEFKLEDTDFIGYIDYVVGDTIYDFKYSNAIQRYSESDQLSLYKYYYEKLNPGKTINHLKFIFIPKVNFRLRKTESIVQFRNRIISTLDTMSIQVVEVPFDEQCVERFLNQRKLIESATEYPKNQNEWCKSYCEYYDLCENGSDWNLIELPKNERKKTKKEKITQIPAMYIYGESYVGKSTFVDSLDDVIILNTDGNEESYTCPVIKIGKTVTMNGRMRMERSGWENFLDAVSVLEEHSQDYRYVVLDLVEDLREYCREYIQKKLKIDHESDSAYSKGWDMVTLEFNKAVKRIKQAGYVPILISKEVSKEITEKNGFKYTKFSPNIPEKTANTLAGMVALTARFYFEDDGSRWIHLSGNPHIFGGGRFNFKVEKCKLDKDELLKAINEANGV